MEIFLYAFSVMYSPGPVNVMGLNAGLTGQFRRTAGFFVGVGGAMFVLFILFGYTGEAIISKAALPYLAWPAGSTPATWPSRSTPPGSSSPNRPMPPPRR